MTDTTRDSRDALLQSLRTATGALRHFRKLRKSGARFTPAGVAAMAHDALELVVILNQEEHRASAFPDVQQEIRATRAVIAKVLADCRRLGWAEGDDAET